MIFYLIKGMHLILSSSAGSRYRGIKLRVGRRGTVWKSHVRDKTSPSLLLLLLSPYLLTPFPLLSSLRPRFQPNPPPFLNPTPTLFSAVTTIPPFFPPYWHMFALYGWQGKLGSMYTVFYSSRFLQIKHYIYHREYRMGGRICETGKEEGGRGVSMFNSHADGIINYDFLVFLVLLFILFVPFLLVLLVLQVLLFLLVLLVILVILVILFSCFLCPILLCSLSSSCILFVSCIPYATVFCILILYFVCILYPKCAAVFCILILYFVQILYPVSYILY